MAFQVSPGVVVTEEDITTFVPGVATAIGAFAGVFRWGPVGEIIGTDSEKSYYQRLGPPSNFNGETWFTGSSFLAYSDDLLVVRAANTTGLTPIKTANVVAGNTALNVGNTAGVVNGSIIIGTTNTASVRLGATVTVANGSHLVLSTASDALASNNGVQLQLVANATALSAIVNTAPISNLTAQIVKTEDSFKIKDENGDFDSSLLYLAKWPGGIGNSLKVSVCDSVDAFERDLDLTANGTVDGSIAFTVDSNTAVVTIGILANTVPNVNAMNATIADVAGNLTVGDLITAGNTVVGQQLINLTSIGSVSNVTLDANSGTVANVTSGSANLVTTGNAFQGLSNGEVIVLYSNSSVWQSYVIQSTTNGNNIVLTTNATFTNASSVWTTLVSDEATLSLSLDDKYKRAQNTSLATITRSWEFAASFDAPPGQSTEVLNNGNTAANDELHVVVVDEKGKFSGVPGTILEKFERLSRSTEGKNDDGEASYYMTVINDTSQYIWAINDRAGSPSANSENVVSSTNDTPLTSSFGYGTDGSDEIGVSVGVLTDAYDKFSSVDDVDISLVLTGKARGGTHGGQLSNYLIDNLAETRMDCVVFVSPEKGDVVNNVGFEAQDIVDFRNSLRSSSYGFLDSGYKKMYDRYNDVFRYVPLNGDIAGLAARTELTNDAWWSFAGLNRGKIKNVVTLTYNPRKPDRDLLYKNGINPVVTFPGDGTLLYGDKTMLAKPSAFDRVNVRRLFIVLEKAISKAAKYSLFEFNDAFTRASFRNQVIPFLRDIQGRRGIIDFLVVCDSSNNPPSVIDRNEFVGDIYIKPARSINFIQLNFKAVPTGVEFSEVVL